MADNKNTIYSAVNSYFSKDAGVTPQSVSQQTNNRKIIIRGNSPQDVIKKGLEIQQKQELERKFTTSVNTGFQKTMQYEAARLPAYMDFEGMEYYPLIAAALDLFMEESTTIGDTGKMLNIYSNKERIKNELENFFYNIVNVNVNLPFWTRNVCKYGDNFVNILGERGKGITHIRQMINYDIERIEKVIDGAPDIIFKQRITGEEYKLFEVAHFRLLTDDKTIPYGSSILSKVRRVFRQCIMAEDALLTNRLLRAADRNLIKVYTGNMDDDDVDAYVDMVGKYIKRKPRYDSENGQIDYRFNPVGNDEDIVIPIRSGDHATSIEKMEGMTSFDKIQDIEYLRQNLCAGLGVPKPFLLFDDAGGGGKNMAQHDIRFAKKIARIQQAMIQELNKMAIIHLLLLGYNTEDVANFKLTLSNPSTQQEQLRVELLQTKAQLYTELTRNEGGIAGMSHTNAKRLVYNMSDKDIIEDYRMQRMERALSQELQDTPLVIKRTGVFDGIDDKYGKLVPRVQGSAEQADNINVAPETPTGSEFQNPNELPEPQGTAQESFEAKFDNTLNELIGVGNENRPKEIIKHMITEDSFIGINEQFLKKADLLLKETDEILSESKIVEDKILNESLDKLIEG